MHTEWLKKIGASVEDAVGKHGAKLVLDTVLKALVIPAEDALADDAPEQLKVFAKAGAAAVEVQTQHLFQKIEYKLGLLDKAADTATQAQPTQEPQGKIPNDAA